MHRKLTLAGFTLLLLLTTMSMLRAGEAPTLQQPPSNANCLEKSVNFLWSHPPGASRFRIEVADNAAFINNIQDVNGIANNYITLDVPKYNTLYFWRVSATFTDNSTSMSTTWAFLTRYLPPEHYSPVDGDMCQSGETKFEWESLADVIAYQFQISSSPDFTNPLHFADQLSSTSYTWNLSQSGTFYYWRVKGIFANCESDWSQPTSLRSQSLPPFLVSPENNVSCQPLATEFHWNTDDYASGYNIQISEYQNFSIIVDSAYGLTQPTYHTTLTKKGAIYYWRVSSSFTTCSGRWSNPFSFKTVEPDPVPIYPPKSEIGVPINTKLEWYVGIPAQTYDLQIATSNDFTSENLVLDVKNLTSTSFTIINNLNFNKLYYWRVKSYYPNCETMWSSVYHFKTEYEPVNQISPDNALDCVPIIAKFEWSPINGVLAYRLQVAKSSDFTDLVVNKPDIIGTSTIVELPDELTTYYWRVRADDSGNFGKWQVSPFHFTSTIHKPRLSAPQDNATGVQRKTTLYWIPTKPDAQYVIEVATDSNFANVIILKENVTDFNLDITVNGFNSTYFWRVKSLYNTCWSAWSDTWKFKTALPPPALTSPADKSMKQPLRLGFIWKKEPTATAYSIQISTNKAFDDFFFTRQGIEVNSIIVGDFSEETTYYWHVNSINSEGVSEWSETWEFTTGKKGPNTPRLISPIDNSIKMPLSIELTWEAVPNADNYQLQINDSKDFSTTIVNLSTLTETSFTFTTDLYNHTFYWRVAAINDVGKSAFSDMWSFTTSQDVVSEKVILVSPKNKATDVARDLQLNWNGVTNADYYHFQLAKDENFNDITSDKIAVYDLKTIELKLDILTKYFWRVRGINSVSEGPWSDVWEFTTWDPSSVFDVPASTFNANAFPNPFTGTVNIHYDLKNEATVRLSVFNIIGEEVAVLVNKTLPAGLQSINWTPVNLESGVYWYSLEIDNARTINKLIYIR